MNDYKSKLAKYYRILSSTSGCGDRAQHYIDDAYQKLVDAHNKLADDEKNANPLPKKQICENDGMDGIAMGLSILDSNLR